MIKYDIENDELVDVLNDSGITGLSFAFLESGLIKVFTLPGFTPEAATEVRSACNDFGYDCKFIEDDIDADGFDLNPVVDIDLISNPAIIPFKINKH